MKRILMALAFALIAAMPGGAKAASGLHPFIAGAPSTSKEELLTRLQSPALKADRQKMVDLFNTGIGRNVAATSIWAADFGGLLSVLRDSEFVVGPCNWSGLDPVIVYGLESKTKFGSLQRDCYPGEQVLFFKGRAIMSLYCGNLIKDAREEKVAPAVVPAPAPKLRRSTFEFELVPDGAIVDP